MSDITNPHPGDRFFVQGFEFRVDYVKKGEVYFVRWKDEPMGQAGRVKIEQWRAQMKARREQ